MSVAKVTVGPSGSYGQKNLQENKVNLQEISKKTNNKKNENKELTENISVWKEKDNIQRFEETMETVNDLQSIHSRLQSESAGNFPITLYGFCPRSENEVCETADLEGNCSTEDQEATGSKKLLPLIMESRDQSGTINDQLSNSKPRAVRSIVRNSKERKKSQQDTYYSLRSEKEATHVEFKPWNFKEDSPHGVYQQARKAMFENLLMKSHEQMAKKTELLMAQAYLKFASKEIQKLKERIAAMQDELQRKEASFQKQKAIYKKKAQDNWLRARVGKRAEIKQISETNFLNRRLNLPEIWAWAHGHEHLRRPQVVNLETSLWLYNRNGITSPLAPSAGQRWPIMQSQRIPQEPRLHNTMSGGSGMDIPPWGADTEACAVCMKNSSSIPPEFQDKGKVKADFIFLKMHLLCDDFHLGPDCFGKFWKPVILAAYLGISAIVIFIWRVILPVKPHVYQVNLQQISEKIDNFKKENAELAEKITVWEQKVNKLKRCLQGTKHLNDEAHKLKDNIKTFDGTKKAVNNIVQGTLSWLDTEKDGNVKTQDLSGDINDQGFKDSKIRAMKLTIHILKEKKKDMEDTCSSLRSAKVAKEVQYKTLQTKVENIYDICKGSRKAAEEKLFMRRHEREEKEKKLSIAQDKEKSASEEILYLKKKTEEIQEQVQKKEKHLQHQIIIYEQKTHDNWLRTCAMNRAVAEEIREATYLKERLAIMQYWKLPKAHRLHPAPGGSGMDKPAWKGDSVCRAFPMERSCVIPREEAGKKKVNMAVKWPPPFPGHPRMPSPKQVHLSSDMCPGPLPLHPPPCPPQELPV